MTNKFVDFIEQEYWVANTNVFQSVNDTTWHWADVRSPMTTDVRLVTHTTQRYSVPNNTVLSAFKLLFNQQNQWQHLLYFLWTFHHISVSFQLHMSFLFLSVLGMCGNRISVRFRFIKTRTEPNRSQKVKSEISVSAVILKTEFVSYI